MRWSDPVEGVDLQPRTSQEGPARCCVLQEAQSGRPGSQRHHEHGRHRHRCSGAPRADRLLAAAHLCQGRQLYCPNSMLTATINAQRCSKKLNNVRLMAGPPDSTTWLLIAWGRVPELEGCQEGIRHGPTVAVAIRHAASDVDVSCERSVCSVLRRTRGGTRAWRTATAALWRPPLPSWLIWRREAF